MSYLSNKNKNSGGTHRDEGFESHNQSRSRGRGRNWGRGRRGRGGGRSGGRNRGHQRGRGGRSSFSNHQRSSFRQDDDIVNIEEVGSGENCVRIAVQGCSHGVLDNIYGMLESYQERNNKAIDLLLCCGDFQALRNTTDFDTISVPEKYREIGSFYKYYAGIKTAPILTIFVGGNHEASSYLQELYYGGWAAPNIYYLGAAGVVRYRGLRIAGISGIYKHHDYRKGRYEFPPYDRSSLRSVYHVRNVEVARLKVLDQLSITTKSEADMNIASSVDIMLSHDWPRSIEQYGDTNALIRKKKFFQQEIQENNLGSPSNEELLNALRPKWWFAGHLHVKFKASYRHRINSDRQVSVEDETSVQENDGTDSNSIKALEIKAPKEEITSETQFIALESSSEKCSDGSDLTDLMTQFLSLDKCLPRRHHLQIVNVPVSIKRNSGSIDDTSEKDDKNDDKGTDNELEHTNRLCYDLEWLAILQKTHHWTKPVRLDYPDPNPQEIHIAKHDLDTIRSRLAERNTKSTSSTSVNGEVIDTKIASTVSEQKVLNIDPTVIPLNFSMSLQPHGAIGSDERVNGGKMVGNAQTDDLLELLNLSHIITVPYLYKSRSSRGIQSADNDILMENSDRIHIPTKNDDENEIDLDDESDDENNGVVHLDPSNANGNTVVNGNDSSPLIQEGQTNKIVEEDSNEIDIESD